MLALLRLVEGCAMFGGNKRSRLALAPVFVSIVVPSPPAERLSQQELLVERVRRELGLVHLNYSKKTTEWKEKKRK